MQTEFITIPIDIIGELPRGKPFTNEQAYIDLIQMADENGEFYSTIRQFMDRWKWSNTRTSSFIKQLEEKDILKTQKRHKKDSLYRINTEFIDISKDTKKTQKRQIKDTGKDEIAEEIITTEMGCVNHSEIQTIIESWNELQSYGIKPVSKLKSGTKRYNSLVARIKEYNAPDVLSAIENIKRSNFLQGKNNRGWVVTFDWFVLPNNFPKVLEGNYIDTNKQETNRSDINASRQSQLEYLLNSIKEEEDARSGG